MLLFRAKSAIDAMGALITKGLCCSSRLRSSCFTGANRLQKFTENSFHPLIFLLSQDLVVCDPLEKRISYRTNTLSLADEMRSWKRAKGKGHTRWTRDVLVNVQELFLRASFPCLFCRRDHARPMTWTRHHVSGNGVRGELALKVGKW